MNLDHWPEAAAERGRQLGVVGAGAAMLLGGPQIDAAELQAVTQDTAALLQLMAELPTLMFGGDLTLFALHHGFSADEAAVLQWSGRFDGGRSFARADLARTDEGFRLLELNVGSSVGGMAMASVAALVGLPQPQAPLDAWARLVARRVAGARSRGAIVEDASLFASERRPLQVQAAALEAAGCGAVDVLSHDELHWDGVALCGPRGPLGWIYPAYSARDVMQAPASYAPIRQAVKAGAVRQPVDLSAKLLGSKMLLASLWELAGQGRLKPAQAALVRRLVPWTERLHPRHLDSALRDQAGWVLKPAVGYGGIGVRVGAETEPEVWRQLLVDALAHAECRFVLQRWCAPRVEEAIVSPPGAAIERYPAHFVWGVYVGDGQGCGLPLLRCQPLRGRRVINYAGGATAGLLGPRAAAPERPQRMAA